jgi:hypothetical protein
MTQTAAVPAGTLGHEVPVVVSRPGLYQEPAHLISDPAVMAPGLAAQFNRPAGETARPAVPVPRLMARATQKGFAPLDVDL